MGQGHIFLKSSTLVVESITEATVPDGSKIYRDPAAFRLLIS